MSSQQWVPPRKPAMVGSVRAARERAEAGLPPAKPQPVAQRPYDGFGLPRNPAPTQTNRTQASPLTQKNNQGPPLGIGVAISRPTQVPQWPLAGTMEDLQYQPPAGRGNPPQRPPRPSYVPSMLNATRLQEHTPSFRVEPPQQAIDRGHTSTFQDDDYDDFDLRSPNSLTSRPSTMSSVGTIPDFPPIPIPPPPIPVSRRSANLGPPPTSRRGASSYYSQASFVSPIPEESPRSKQSHGSYASSAAIPNNWDSDSTGFSPGLSPGYEYDEKYYDDKDLSYAKFQNGTIEEGRESRESNFEDNDDRGLIRSASFGRRAKPSMITTRGVDRSDMPKLDPTPQKNDGILTQDTSGGLNTVMWPMPRSMDSPLSGRPSPLAGGTGLIDESSSSSENEVPSLKTTRSEDSAPATAYNAVGANAMLGAYAAASSLQPGTTTPSRTPSPGFSRLSAIRRPPRLNIDAVRDAEARGSLTSLPDLIRRATRLAAMMDRGKRPASRVALDDFPFDKEIQTEKRETRQSGLSGMLAAFPPPGLATPTHDLNTPIRPVSSWPVINSGSPGNSKSKTSRSEAKKGRRCCGLPLWAFILLLLLLIILIAAAVLIPLYLLVFNKKPTPPELSSQQKCAQDPATACQNGGIAMSSFGTCACICISGFTGSTCVNPSSTACTTTTLSTDLPDVTLGDAIPRLVLAAQSNFSIPLDSSIILARFSSSNLSCLSENALVTFDGVASNDVAAKAAAVSSVQLSLAQASATARLISSAKTALQTPFAREKRQEASINGVYVDSLTKPSPPAQTSMPTAISTPSTSYTSSTTASQAKPTAIFLVSDTVTDFARVAVLFILQQETLEKASVAQNSFQRFFNLATATNKAAQNISLGGTNTANLVDFKLSLAGEIVGSLNTTTLSRRQIPFWDC